MILQTSAMDETIHARACRLFGALANPTRLRITELLCGSPASVNEIARAVGISQSGASQHLSILLRAGLIVVSQSRTTRTYAVRGPRIGRIIKLIEEFCAVHDLHGSDDVVEMDEESIDDF